MTAEERSVELARIAAVAAGEKGGKDVVAFDVSEQLAITDIFVVGSVDNAPQMRAVTDEIEDRMREAGAKAVRREGQADSRWTLLDFVDLVVHVQHIDERDFYGLDRLWSDCPKVDLS